MAISGELLLAFTTLLGATSYIGTKFVLEEITPLATTFYRFLLGFLCLVIARPKTLFDVSREVARAGAILGALIGFSITLFFSGLRVTEAGLAAFLCNSEFLIIPLIELILFRRFVPRYTFQSILVGLLGVILLMLSETSGRNSGLAGQFYLLGAALGFSFIAILNVRFARTLPVYPLATVMMLSATVFSGATAALAGEMVVPGGRALWILLYLGVVVTGLRFFLVLVAQRTVSATHTGIIYLLEPVLAALFGVLIFAETVGAMKLSGMLLMVASTLMIFRLKLAKPDQQIGALTDSPAP